MGCICVCLSNEAMQLWAYSCNAYLSNTEQDFKPSECMIDDARARVLAVGPPGRPASPVRARGAWRRSGCLQAGDGLRSM